MGWHLTPLGWFLLVAALALVVLAIVFPSQGTIGGLIAVIAVWAVVLGMNFPSARWPLRGDVEGTDWGRQEAERSGDGRGSD